jgi:hypothetical protein
MNPQDASLFSQRGNLRCGCSALWHCGHSGSSAFSIIRFSPFIVPDAQAYGDGSTRAGGSPPIWFSAASHSRILQVARSPQILQNIVSRLALQSVWRNRARPALPAPHVWDRAKIRTASRISPNER